MTYEQLIKISSDDGKNVVESVLNDLQKQADKGTVEFGIDIQVERIEKEDLQEVEFE